ncbi:hypothetical protein A4A49_39270 [Nicotiana attenuata]|uniref:Uncharacterized protein n=1 Tax=Nicotiana attenuata TaxID=49451 RepID=A0A1J6JS21_NICAT|nr:hypothetical protein A4A49_39270 [Nicotiana attenuata]
MLTCDISREDHGGDIDSNREATVVTVDRVLVRINIALEQHVVKVNNVDKVTGEKKEEIPGQVVNNSSKAGIVSAKIGARSIAPNTLEAAVQTAILDVVVSIGSGIKGDGKYSNVQVHDKDQQVTQAEIIPTATNRGEQTTDRGASNSTKVAGALKATGKSDEQGIVTTSALNIDASRVIAMKKQGHLQQMKDDSALTTTAQAIKNNATVTCAQFDTSANVESAVRAARFDVSVVVASGVEGINRLLK